jgi:hypothetical protein
MVDGNGRDEIDEVAQANHLKIDTLFVDQDLINNDMENMDCYDQSYNYNINKEDLVVIGNNNDSNEWITAHKVEKRNESDEVEEKFQFYKREFEDENKEFDRVKRLKSQLFQGYNGYDLLDEISPISELTKVKLRSKMEIFLNKLDEGKSYTLLLIIRYLNDIGETSGYTAGKSYKVNKDINIELLCDRMMMDYSITRTKYNLHDADGDVIIVGKEWLSDEDFKVSKEELTKVYNDLLSSNRGDRKTVRSIDDIKKELNIENYGLDRYNRILMNNYGEQLSNVVNVPKGNDTSEEGEAEFYRNGELILEVRKGKESVSSSGNLLSKEVKNVIVWSDEEFLEEGKVIDYSKLKGSITLSWKDKRINDKEFIRDYGQLNCIYKEGGIDRIEIKYNLPSLNSDLVDLNYDDKIGVIDFETFGNKEDGLGHHNPYAGGWARLNHIEKLYIEGNESSEEFVLRVIKSILNDKDNHNRVFYCHNLGRFDSILLLSAVLESNNYKVKGMWKDNTIISLNIKNLKNGIKIKIFDSLLLMKEKLRDLLKSYNCETLKGIFPYRFMNKNRLNYIGERPELKYYDGIDIDEYERLDMTSWNAKEETLKYLESDLKGLLEVILKFSKTYYNKYSLNITKYRTLPGLTFGLYNSQYYDDDLNVKLVKGNLERDIRQSYFGGNVDVFEHEIKGDAFGYDMNSEYPYAMLNDMPIGDPVLTDETNIHDFFGFAFGEITPPSEDVLKNLYIQYRNEDGTVSCPRNKFERLIFSEEIKYAISQGYVE